MDIKSVLSELRAAIEPERGELVETAKTIWANPELAFNEHIASKLLVGLLKKYGFAVECPYAGMDTAFRAEFTRGQGGATFALAAEYDALAGIGHACGHNTGGVASVAAALAAKNYMEKHDVSGTIVVLGTPGEEGGGGKVLMLKNADCLKGVDAVMMTHAIGGQTKRDAGCTGIRRYEVIFHGRASHAAGSPEKGLNALDAQILLFNAIGLFRQQMNRDALIHGVILDGGEAANVIPDYTRSRIYLRSQKEELIDELYDRFTKMIEGAALMTGCTSEIKQYSIPYKARKPNSFLNELFIAGAKALDMNVTDELPHGRGSSDFGDFSHAAPGAHPYFSICAPGQPDAPGHSELLKKYANSDYGYSAMLNAGAVLAYCALEVLSDPKLRAEIRAEFEKK
jgi:amidohydrolase